MRMRRFRWPWPAGAALIAGCCLAAFGADPAPPTVAVPGRVVLFDFEADADFAVWHNEGRATLDGDLKPSRVRRLATSGASAMELRAPVWKPGMAEWPAFECRPPVTDWRGFDRLAFDVSNESPAPQLLGLLIADARKPTRQGLSWHQRLPPRSLTRVVLDLAAELQEKGVDPADIRVMHLFTEQPPAALVLCLDNVALLKPGESLPPLPETYCGDYAALQAAAVAALRESVGQAGAKLTLSAAGCPAVAAWVAASRQAFAAQLDALEARTRQGGAQALALQTDIAGLEADWRRLEHRTALRLAFEPIRAVVSAPGAVRDDVVAGFATSMEKVLPRAETGPLQSRTRVELTLARGEREAFQVVVVPCGADLSQAAVRATELRGPGGASLGAGCVTAVPVGYVETRSVPPYGSSHVGWWPDPILEFLPAADIARGDAQAFWIRVHAPREQAAGTYVGKLQVSNRGAPLFVFDFAVRVYGFAVPAASPLPLAVTFAPEDNATAGTRAEQSRWRREPDYPLNAWKKHRLRWADFLADYYLTYDSLYTHAGPDFEVVGRLHEQGRLGCFNLGYYGPCGDSPAERDAWQAKTLDRLRPQFDRARALGVLDHAYIYGCDESPRDEFPGVQRAAERLKAAFPGVVVMTTTYDNSYGQETEMKAVDAWCPLTPRFDPDKVAQARAAGKFVWWYICCGPHHPPANMFLEYPAIEGRLLMGAMTAKYRPDGFLYYQISIWNARRPIASGPFTDWDPRSWTTYHGDGAWTCVGPDGIPLPTIRLENFRDGLEDYAYFRILEHLVRQGEARGDALPAGRQAWLAEARAALQVPDALVASLTAYTRDPQQVYAFRNRLGELIERAGVPDADPWGADFGVRGFRGR